MKEINLNSLKSLVIFKTLYETGSTTKTAKALGITQSGVSRSLGVLEENFDIPLFIRDKNRLTITPEGEEVYSEVLGLMNNLDELKHSILALREFGASRLRIASIPGLGFGYVPKIIADLLAVNPKINIYYDMLGTKDVVRQVEAGHFNMGFVTLPITSTQLQIDVIAKTNAVCILPRDHSLAEKEAIHLSDLEDQHIIISNQPNIAADQLLKLISENQISIKAKTEANIAGLCALVGENVGIGVINPITARDLNNDHFITRPFIPSIAYSFGLIYPKKWRGNKLIAQMHNSIKNLEH